MEERCDVGKIINRISHQLKRRMNCHEEEDSLTNMQRHVLHYILLQSMSRDIYQKDVEAGISDPEIHSDGNLTAFRKKRIYFAESRRPGCAAEKDRADRESGKSQRTCIDEH